MLGLIKIYCFDIITFNFDRNMNNIAFISSDKHGLRLAPMFDNEFIFEKDALDYGLSLGVDVDDEVEDPMAILKKFLSYSDEDSVNIFYEMFDKLTVEKLGELIDKVENERGISLNKGKILHFYRDYRDYLEVVIDKYLKKGLK